MISRGDISREEFETINKIVAFRNVLVHDYLSTDYQILRSVIFNKSYLFLKNIVDRISSELVCS